MYYVVVAGGRDFNGHLLLKQSLHDLLIRLYNDGMSQSEICFVSADCEGADQLAKFFSSAYKFMHLYMPIHWNLYGNDAWKYANENMANIANELIVFWNGVSVGTKDMIDRVESRRLKVTVVKYE